MPLAYETQATKSGVKDEQRVHRQPNTIFDNTATAEYTDSGGKGPANEDDVDRNARYPDQLNGGEKRGDDKRE